MIPCEIPHETPYKKQKTGVSLLQAQNAWPRGIETWAVNKIPERNLIYTPNYIKL